MHISVIISVLRVLTILKRATVSLYDFLPGSRCYLALNIFIFFDRLCWAWLRVSSDFKIVQTFPAYSEISYLNYLSEMKQRYRQYRQA